MKDFTKMTLNQLRSLPGYTSGSSCNMSLQQDIENIFAELDYFSSDYGNMTSAELCTYLRDLADDIEYYNIPQMREIQEENHNYSKYGAV